jgi:hypothetical protein
MTSVMPVNVDVEVEMMLLLISDLLPPLVKDASTKL